MECCTYNSLEPMKPEDCSSDIIILMANADLTCYIILTTVLHPGHHRVLQFESSTDALKALQEEKARPDLVLMDVEMPDANRLELLEHVEKVFQRPAPRMSVDGNEEIVLGGLDHGLSLYFAKAISHNSVQSLWQHVLATRQSLLMSGAITYGYERPKKEPLQRIQPQPQQALGKDSSDHRIKQRLIWTQELHEKFLEAIKQLEHERILPQKILELMNVPGLTKRMISSHLQKYRKQFQQGTQLGFLPRRSKFSFTSSIPSSSSESDQENLSLTSPKSLTYKCMGNLGNNLPSLSGSSLGNNRLQHLKIASSAYKISENNINQSILGLGTEQCTTAASFTGVPFTGHQGYFRTAGDYYGNFCSGIENVWLRGNSNVLRRNIASSIAQPYGKDISGRYPFTSINPFQQKGSMLPPPLATSQPRQHNSDRLLALSCLMESDDIPEQPDDNDKLNTLYAEFSKLI